MKKSDYLFVVTAIILIYIASYYYFKKPNPKEGTNDGSVVIGNTIYQIEYIANPYNYDEAKAYCQNLEFGGYANWRLPKGSELIFLSRKNSSAVRHIDPKLWFWCVEEMGYSNENAQVVYLGSGNATTFNKAHNRGRTLCVRDRRVDKNIVY
ncbi:MAG: DUF1566 domain-containing protein [Campylobacterota bacterium]|nr:DUF1566 domain-containing protein [Campylobacterota bacterium]